ncbi:MAG: hypothetical protein ACK413_02705, partial [Patescibacteria group bacterium]
MRTLDKIFKSCKIEIRIKKEEKMKKYFIFIIAICLLAGCTRSIPPLGEGVYIFYSKVSLFFDWNNGIFWASNGLGDGHHISLLSAQGDCRYEFFIPPEGD